MNEIFYVINCSIKLKICTGLSKHPGLKILFLYRSSDRESLTPRVRTKGGGVTSRNSTAASNKRVQKPIKGSRQHYSECDFIDAGYRQIYRSIG